MIPYTHESYQLLHEGTVAFAEIESAGWRVDEEYIRRTIKRTTKRISHILQDLEGYKVVKIWRKTFGTKTNLGSDDQLAKVLFDKMGFPKPNKTASGEKFKTDEDALLDIDDPFVQPFLRMRKLETAVGTFLKGIQREVVDGFIHPFINLNIAQTYRSSSENPNTQNQPVRDEEVMQLIRRAFVPRRGRQLIETDYSGAEVKVATCYHHDPKMIIDITDPKQDMHKDMAMECYKLSRKEIGDTKQKPWKNTRYAAKNMFVFPQFYGDFYIDCARSLWKAIHRLKLVTADGRSLYEHLKAKGIHDLGSLNPKDPNVMGTFVSHLKAVEHHFWYDRYPVYNQWKQDWYDDYMKKGWFKTLTGFICQGFLRRNQVINYPVQGSAFHCLLWAVIEILKELKKQRMKSQIVMQIHDSIVGDVVPEERDDYLQMCKEIMVKRLMKHWDWFVVPMEIEADVAPVDASWADKEPVKIPK